MRYYRKFEKANNKAAAFFSDIKDIHDLMKSNKKPVDIDYDGPYAEVKLPAGFLSRKDQEPFATIVWNIMMDDGPRWNMTVYSTSDGNHKKVGTFNDVNAVAEKLSSLYDRVASKD